MLSPVLDPVELLRDSDLFAGLLDEDYELLGKGTRVRTFGTGAPLFYEHDEGGSAFLIVEGCVSIERTADSSKGDAETVQIAVRGPGEFIGELSLFDEVPRNADARALEPTTALQLRGKHVLACAQQSPELALALMRALAKKLREATDKRTQLRVANVRTRLLNALAEEAKLHGVKETAGMRIVLITPDRKLTQGELGARAGCDRAVVNRTLAELVEEGVIEKDKLSILVRHAPRSQAVAGTLLRAAKENARSANGSLSISERQLRTAPKMLAMSQEAFDAEVARLIESDILVHVVGALEVRSEVKLAEFAAGRRV